MWFLALWLVFFWEFLSIVSEILFTKGENKYFIIALMCIAWVCLLYWYYLGNRFVQNLWIVYIVSITAILILEPIVIYKLTGETPHLGAQIGFTLGTFGFLSAILIK